MKVRHIFISSWKISSSIWHHYIMILFYQIVDNLKLRLLMWKRNIRHMGKLNQSDRFDWNNDVDCYNDMLSFTAPHCIFFPNVCNSVCLPPRNKNYSTSHFSTGTVHICNVAKKTLCAVLRMNYSHFIETLVPYLEEKSYIRVYCT